MGPLTRILAVGQRATVTLGLLYLLCVSTAWGLYLWPELSRVSGDWGDAGDAGDAVALARQRHAALVRHAAALPKLLDFVALDAADLIAKLESLPQDRASEAGRAATRVFLAHALTDAGLEAELQAFSATGDRPGGVNVVAERPGTVPGAGVVLLGAHYDAVPGSPGADDNGTGIVAALGLARHFARIPTARALRIVFFDQEEQGLAGSFAYTQSLERKRGLRAVIILEMLGASCRTVGCQRYPRGLPIRPATPFGDYLAVLGNAEFPELLTAALRIRGPLSVFGLLVPNAGRDLPDTRRSDHAPFWSAGIPAVLLTDTGDFRNRRYHSEADTIDTIDRDFFREASRVAGALLADALSKSN